MEATKLQMLMQRANQTGYMRGAVTGTPLDMATMIDPQGRTTMMNTIAGWNRPPTHNEMPTVPAETIERHYEDPTSSIYGAGRYLGSNRKKQKWYNRYYEPATRPWYKR